MPEATSHAERITVSIPVQVLADLRGEAFPEDREREFRAEHTGTNGPLEEWLWREALLPFCAEQLGYNPDAVTLTVDGDFAEGQPRSEDGTFDAKDGE